ncbi:DUF7342 family protein [Haloarcula laminariae]|uniref:DUF7342 family protein n=1 Tax=Haloarcula laminariae TaxID=2961577 RepID=UPI002404BDD8|nr:helix-turn-helix domain-containing protein [Halomicroarcula sp. FL173]
MQTDHFSIVLIVNKILRLQARISPEMVSIVQESVQDEPSWVTLLENVYETSKTDQRVFAVVADVDEPVTVDEVAERIERHRSTASRSLTWLVEAGLLERMTRDGSGPSYRYVYRMRDADALADEMHRLLSAWYVRMDERIGEFTPHYEQAYQQSA